VLLTDQTGVEAMIGTSKTCRLALFVSLAASAAIASLVVLPSASSFAATRSAGNASACATVRVTANPPVNAQNSPFEKIKNTVTSCATSTETVTLTQHIAGPFTNRDAASRGVRTWTITLVPKQSVLEEQHKPYFCCGTFNVHDQVSSAGVVLAKAKTSFTFA
jgi:hypothetical protein